MKSLMALLLIIVIVSAFMVNTHALTPPIPEPSKVCLGDGLMFHLTPPEFVEQGYPQSGLYRNGELIYTFDEGILWRNPNAMFFSDDFSD